jgi:hypothetical protein
MKKHIRIALNCAMITLIIPVCSVFADDDFKLNLSPSTVQISAFYNGTTVQVTGQIPAAAEAVVKVSGIGEELHLKKKGKVGGVLWMNTGDVTFENAPNVEMIYMPKAITDIESSPVNHLGLKTLKDKITILPSGEDKNFLFGEFLKLKQKDGLYTLNEDTIYYGIPKQNVKTVTADITIPTKMKKGTYTVELAVVQDGKELGIATKELTIEQVGFPAQLTKFAFGKPLLYGVLSSLIAIAAGLFTGIVFKGKSGAH